MAADHNLSADPTIALTSGYGGTGYNTQWVQDPDVGVVVECTKVPPILLHCILLWHGMMVKTCLVDNLINPCVWCIQKF